MVAGLNIIIFMIIAFLAHREKLNKKRNNRLSETSSVSGEITLDGASEEKAGAAIGVFAVEPKIVEASGRGI